MEWSADNFKNETRPKLSDLVKMADYRKHEGEFGSYRFIGDLKPICTITIPIYKDGKPLYSEKIKKNVEIPFYVTNYDYTTGKFIEGKECPFMKVAEFMSQYLPKPIRPREQKLAQAINRSVQEDGQDDQGVFRRRGKMTEKERSTKKKDNVKSDCRTPVEVHTIGYMMAQDINSIIQTNKVVLTNPANPKQKKTVLKPPTDPKYGCDVLIKYDGTVKANKKTFVQKGDKTALTKDELWFLQWDLDKVMAQLVMNPTEAKAEAQRLLLEFKKSLKGGGAKAASQEPDESDLPGDIESGSGDGDMPDFGEDGGDEFASAPAKTAPKKGAGKPAAKKDDDADSLFGDDDGIDIEGDLDDDLPF